SPACPAISRQQWRASCRFASSCPPAIASSADRQLIARLRETSSVLRVDSSPPLLLPRDYGKIHPAIRGRSFPIAFPVLFPHCFRLFRAVLVYEVSSA